MVLLTARSLLRHHLQYYIPSPISRTLVYFPQPLYQPCLYFEKAPKIIHSLVKLFLIVLGFRVKYLLDCSITDF